MAWILNLLARLASALPRRSALAVGRSLGAFLGGAIRFRRREVERTLRRCFPDWTPARARATAGGMYRHLGMVTVETLRMSVRGPSEIAEGIRVLGEEHLERVRQEPMLLLMAHLGNWEACSVLMHLGGFPGAVVVKRIKNPGLQRYITSTRKALGLELVDREHAFRPVVRLLKEGYRVGIVLDQNTTEMEGVFTDFFGRLACTSAGLAVLSAMTGRPVMPVFCIRREDGGFDLHLHPPLDPPASRKPEAIHEATQGYTRIIEDMIRRFPDQWLWLHRRWRTQPGSGGADMEGSRMRGAAPGGEGQRETSTTRPSA